MCKKTLVAIFVIALAASNAEAARSEFRQVFSEKATKTLPFPKDGTVFIESWAGSITVTGGPGDELVIDTVRTVKVVGDYDFESVRDGLNVRVDRSNDLLQTKIRSVGLIKNRQVLTTIDYKVKLPASAAVNVIGGVGELFKVEGVKGRVFIRNVSGRIIVDRVDGPIIVDSINADVFVFYRTAPRSGCDIKALNGNIQVRVPEDADLRWVALTMKGDILTGGLGTLAGELVERGGQRTYRAVLNRSVGPVLQTSSLTGSLYLLPISNLQQLAASVLPLDQPTPDQEDIGRDYNQVVTTVLMRPPTTRTFFIRKGRHEGNLEQTLPLGANVFYAQVDGTANIVSNGGEVVLGKVGGECTIESGGGEVNLGEVTGRVDASTAAGDVFVTVARKGGRLSTGGGSIQILYAGDSMNLVSGGGNIAVRQVAGGLDAKTASGDILVAIDPKPKSDEAINLDTRGGNIVFEVSSNRGFDIDAEIETDRATAYQIESSYPGLTTVREKSGTRVTIRARGKINGGGTKVTLRARNGNIIINRVPENRIVFVR